MAVFITENVLENETSMPTAEQADTILTLLAPLIADQVSSCRSCYTLETWKMSFPSRPN